MRIRTRRMGDEWSIRIRQKNLNGDSDHFGILEMVELGLLGAVDADLLAGIQSREDIGSEKADRLNVGAGLGRLQVEDMLVHELAQRVVVALTEEIGFAHCGVGKRCVEGRQRLNEQK